MILVVGLLAIASTTRSHRHGRRPSPSTRPATSAAAPADASHCNLREAIAAANQLPDTDTIAFAIAGPPPHTIQATEGPWRLFAPVIIDGTTQPGYAGTPVVELDGSHSSPSQTGLSFFEDSGGSTVRGFVVNRFKGTGIVISATGNFRIEDNYIGTDPTGTLARGNGLVGVQVLGRPLLDNGHNRIVRNVISANGLWGIGISGDEDDNVIQGNDIGTDASGSAPLGNGRWGIRIGNGPTTTISSVGPARGRATSSPPTARTGSRSAAPAIRACSAQMSGHENAL